MIGDSTHARWLAATKDQKDSVIAGVERIVANPEITAEELHAEWKAYKVAQGYVYGPVKNDETKEHPNIVPWMDLPLKQRKKDDLFLGIVKALL